MKYFIYIISILIALLTLNYNAPAQTECDEASYEYCETVLPSFIPCDITPGSPYCTIGYRFCWKSENGVGKVFISELVYNEDCPCLDAIKGSYILKNIFGNPLVLETFGITQPIIYENIEVYVANCSMITYTGIPENCQDCYRVVNCEGTSCCMHSYQVKYRYKCISHPDDGLTVDWFTETAQAYLDDNCNEPCSPNCSNWSGIKYSSPSMEMIEIKKLETVNPSIIIVNNKISLSEELEILEYKDLNFYLYKIDGSLIVQKKINDLRNITDIIQNIQLSKGVYLYEIRKNDFSKTGKILKY